jgi:hypothetical protein
MFFLGYFFPPTKYMEKRRDIYSFQQEDGESLYDAWERYKLLLKGFPTHKFSAMEITLIFTNGLKTQTRMLLDYSAGVSMQNKIVAEIRELVENMALNEYRLHGNDQNVSRRQGIFQLDTQDALIAGHKLLSNKLEAIAKKLETPETAKLVMN